MERSSLKLNFRHCVGLALTVSGGQSEDNIVCLVTV